MCNRMTSFTQRTGRYSHSVGKSASGLCVLLLTLTWASLAQAHLDPPGARYATWDSVEDVTSVEIAVTSLWNSRITFSRPWAWGTLDANLDPIISASINKGSGLTHVHPPQRTANSVYLIPKVSIRSNNLPRGLHHIAAALLTYNLGNAAPLTFYPAYTDSEGLTDLMNTAYQNVGTYNAFLNAETRSRHDNDTLYLPTVAVPVCPAGVATAINTAWNAGTALNPAKQQAMDALNAGVGMAGVTNAQKWHCFAMRAAPPGVNIINVASGYIEIGHPDGTDREYRESSNGRIVYDYVNGRVFYTPTHYRPTYYFGAELRVSDDNFCPATQTCVSPFFEIVQ